MNLKPALSALAAAPMLSGCLIIDADGGRPATVAVGPSRDPAEPVYAVSFGRDGATVRVSSNGCTKKADFEPVLKRGALGAELRFIRRVEDRCRAFVAAGVDLSWRYDELGLDPRESVRIVNAFTPGPGTRPPEA